MTQSRIRSRTVDAMSYWAELTSGSTQMTHPLQWGYTNEWMLDEFDTGPRRHYPDRRLERFKLVQPGMISYPLHPISEWQTVTYVDQSSSGATALLTPARDRMLQWAYNEESDLVELDFQRNNKFNLLVSLTELDETIASFLNPRSLGTYGGIQWGVLPLVSDLKSLYNTYHDVFNNGVLKGLSGQTVRRSKKVEFEHDGVIYSGKFFAKGYLSTLELPPPDDMGNALRILADELGFHPDLSTVWDAVPLSFLVDEFLPIGDYIDDMHPRGWFKPKLKFTGTVSFEGLAQVPHGAHSWLPRRNHFIWPRNPVDIQKKTFWLYLRAPLTLTTLDVISTDQEYQAPSARDVFNAAYIGFLGKGSGL